MASSIGKKPLHVTVTGAAGQIGYALAFRIASGQLLGPDQPIVLRMLEIEPAMKSLQGVAMELDDCAFPLLHDMVLTSKAEEAFDGCSWALLVGSVPRKAGMERGDLLAVNGGIFGPQGKAIAARAAADVRILVVGNPCNTNCLIARLNAPDVPAERWFAMTRLDENRAKTQLATKAGVPLAQVSNMAIWGNHSATQYPDARNARIGGKPVPEVIKDAGWLMGDFITTVQKRGAAVIEMRGLSSAGSAANAAIDSGSASAPPRCRATGIRSRSSAMANTGRRRGCSSVSRSRPTASAGRWSRGSSTTLPPWSESRSQPRSWCRSGSW